MTADVIHGLLGHNRRIGTRACVLADRVLVWYTPAGYVVPDMRDDKRSDRGRALLLVDLAVTDDWRAGLLY